MIAPRSIVALFALIALIAIGLAGRVLAGSGHSHTEAAASAGVDMAQRLADGSVFLPKLSQRQLGVRTLIAIEAATPIAVELVGRVVMDPNAGGKVQATLAGRIETGPRGLPSPGRSVSKGEVLAVLRPTTGVLERSNQAAQIAELRAGQAIAQKRLARLEQLAGTVPQKDIDAARGEVQSLTDRLAAVATSLATTEALVAPVAGVISTVNVVAGQVVEARELLFEIVDPARLQIEALSYDTALIGNIAAASASVGAGDAFALELVGAGRLLKEQALPIRFRTKPPAGATGANRTVPVLAIGQPVKVVVQTRETIRGMPIPAAAVVKNPSNQDIVWVHTSPESFVPKTVRISVLDGVLVSVTDGLKPGDRVVVAGASLVNQVR